jgi:hypothetical protein
MSGAVTAVGEQIGVEPKPSETAAEDNTTEQANSDTNASAQTSGGQQ